LPLDAKAGARLDSTHIILAGVVIFAAHLLSTVTGFGANVLGLPLLAMVVGFVPGKQALIVQGALLYAYLSIRWWKYVNRRELRRIVVVAGIGLVIGIVLIDRVPQRAAIVALGIFVMLVGLRGLLNLAPQQRAPLWAARLLLLLGGVVHGSLTTGGPLLTIYCRRVLRDKSSFRATLAVLWLALAIGLIIGWTGQHAWHPQSIRVITIGLPFALLGLFVGELVHHRVNELAFKKAVNLTLVVLGAVLLFSR
jgi:uncharacterized membrane protein YfcA